MMMHTYFEIETLAKDLGISARTFYSLSNTINAHYRKVEIPKSDGTMRKLSIPDPLLKKVQRRIAEVILFTMPVSVFAMAYSCGDSPLNNALKHAGKHHVLKLDIRKYFDHVTYPLVKQKVFIKERFSEKVRILLTMLCMYDEKLPQGAPTSPAISNILLYDLDETLGRWCREQNITYTRYCDDLTFSGDLLDVPAIIEKVRELLKGYGLFINRKKTAFIHDGQRKKVTGIIVNRQPNVPLEYRKKIRQEMHYIQRYGVDDHMKKTSSKITKERYLRGLLGRINYVLSVRKSPEFEKYSQTVRSLLAESSCIV